MSKNKFNTLEELIGEYVKLIPTKPKGLGIHVKFSDYEKQSEKIREKINDIINEKDEEKIKHIVEFTIPHAAKSEIKVKYNNEIISIQPPEKAYLHSYSNAARLTTILLGTDEDGVLDGNNVIKYGDLIKECLKFFKANIDKKAEDFWDKNRIKKYIENKKTGFLNSKVISPFNELKFWYFSANKDSEYYDKFPLENGSLKNSLNYLKNIFKNRDINAETLHKIFEKEKKELNAKEKEKFTLSGYLYIDQLANLIDKLEATEVMKDDSDISKFYQKLWNTIKDEKIKKEKKNLNKFKNIIYHGAPGTGKTYEIIKEIDDYILKLEGEREFIQFHSSYYYEDFIGGLKPNTNKDGGELTLEYKNGIFKELCKKAAKYEIELYKLFKDKSQYKNIISKNPTWNELVKEEVVDDKEEVKINNLKIDKNKEILYQFPPFFIIIDEINRADLSKVFGELLFAIEDDYRGIENKFKLSSSNIENEESAVYWEDNNEKGEAYFFVPKNLYIRGTMNDIDKSVDSIDFAFRRRFKWEEKNFDSKKIGKIIESKGYEDLDIDDYITKCRNLNKDIKEKISIADESYEIGHAIFANITKYLNNNEITRKSKEELFDNHIEPILYNYLKMDYGNTVADVDSFRNNFIK